MYNWWDKRIREGYSIFIEPIEENYTGNWEEREKYWIRHYIQMGFKLLNVSEGGCGIITVEQRSKTSRQRSIEAHQKPIVALTKDGEFYKEFSSCTEAANHFHVVMTAITNAISGFSKSACGYIWIEKASYDPNKKYKYESRLTTLTIYQFDLEGNLIQHFANLKECEQVLGLNKSQVGKAVRTKRIYKTFIFSKTPSINLQDYI